MVPGPLAEIFQKFCDFLNNRMMRLLIAAVVVVVVVVGLKDLLSVHATGAQQVKRAPLVSYHLSCPSFAPPQRTENSLKKNVSWHRLCWLIGHS